MKTVTEKYRAIKSGQISESEFVRQMRLAHPQHITQFNGFNDTVQILRNKGLLFEEEYKTINISDDAVRRGTDYELTAMNIDPAGKISSEDIQKAKNKAIANIEKNPVHYYELLANESSKVDKHDKEVEVKKGNHKDTHNGLKKAELKEDVEKELGASNGEISDLVKNEKHIKDKLDKAGKKYSKSYSKDKHGQKIVVFKLNEEVIAEGTRALVGYLAGDRLTTAYNHYDGYPSHLGKALQMHYNDDEAAKDLALKGYISSMDADTGEIQATHNDPPGKIKLSDDEEQMAREIGEEIDSMGADYGYIWDDRSNRWITIKNTGIRSMIDQIIAKMGDYAEVQEADLDETEEEYLAKKDAAIKKAMGKDIDEVDASLDPYEDKKEIIKQVIQLIKGSIPTDNETIKDFIRTHYEDIINLRDDEAILDEFQEFLSVNTDYVDEKKVNERNDIVPTAELKATDAFRDAGIDMNKPVLVLTQDGGHGGQETKGTVSAEEALKMFQQLRAAGKGREDHYEFDNELNFSAEGYEYKLSYFEEESTTTALMQKSEVSEKKGKDHDGDGDVDGDDYMAAKDKAIKKAMGKDEAIRESLKAIITKVLEEKQINEAATNVLAAFGDDYAGFDGMKSAINALENIVTDIEQYYDKTRTKIQKVYDTLGEIRNEEGLKVGGFLAPAVEQAFNRDLRPVIKQGFTKGIDMPQVKKMASPGMAQETEAPKQTVFGLNEKKK